MLVVERGAGRPGPGAVQDRPDKERVAVGRAAAAPVAAALSVADDVFALELCPCHVDVTVCVTLLRHGCSPTCVCPPTLSLSSPPPRLRPSPPPQPRAALLRPPTLTTTPYSHRQSGLLIRTAYTSPPSSLTRILLPVSSLQVHDQQPLVIRECPVHPVSPHFSSGYFGLFDIAQIVMIGKSDVDG